MPNGDAPERSFLTRVRTRLLAAAALLALYAGFGFLGLPWVIRRQLEQRASAFLHREVTVTKVRVNPFALSVTIDGLLVKERDGSPWLSWDRPYVNAKLWPLVKKEARSRRASGRTAPSTWPSSPGRWCASFRVPERPHGGSLGNVTSST